LLHLLSGIAAVASLHGAIHVATLVNPLSQLMGALGTLVAGAIDWLYRVTDNYGWSMLLLALFVSPLSSFLS